MKKRPQTRKERLAAALRENLKRRKARSRAVAKKESGHRVTETEPDAKMPDSDGTVRHNDFW